MINWNNGVVIQDVQGTLTSGASQQLTLATTSGSGGDTFTITPNAALKTLLQYSGTATSAIAYDATAQDVEDALNALVGTDGAASAKRITCAGGPLDGSDVLIYLTGSAAGFASGAWTTTDTGGVSSTITNTTAGTTGSLRGYAQNGAIAVDTTNKNAYENQGNVFLVSWKPCNGIPSPIL